MTNEEVEIAQLDRKRPTRLSRSGDPVSYKPTLEEKAEEIVEAFAEVGAESQWDGRGRVPAWLIRVVALALPALGIWLVFSVGARKIREVTEAAMVPPAPVQAGKHSPVAVAQAFLAADTVEERLAVTRQRASVEPRMREHSYTVPRLAVEVESIVPLGKVHAMGEKRFFRFGVTTTEREKRLLCVVDTAEGLLVDWDAFMRSGTVPEGGPHKGKFSEATVRVFVKEVRYYNYSFSDEEKWVSFELWNPDWEAPVYGYAKRNAVTRKILTRLASRAGEQGQRMTISLRGFGADPTNRQYEIKEVLAAGWVLGDGDFETLWARREEFRKQAAQGQLVRW